MGSFGQSFLIFLNSGDLPPKKSNLIWRFYAPKVGTHQLLSVPVRAPSVLTDTGCESVFWIEAFHVAVVTTSSWLSCFSSWWFCWLSHTGSSTSMRSRGGHLRVFFWLHLDWDSWSSLFKSFPWSINSSWTGLNRFQALCQPRKPWLLSSTWCPWIASRHRNLWCFSSVTPWFCHFSWCFFAAFTFPSFCWSTNAPGSYIDWVTCLVCSLWPSLFHSVPPCCHHLFVTLIPTRWQLSEHSHQCIVMALANMPQWFLWAASPFCCPQFLLQPPCGLYFNSQARCRLVIWTLFGQLPSFTLACDLVQKASPYGCYFEIFWWFCCHWPPPNQPAPSWWIFSCVRASWRRLLLGLGEWWYATTWTCS